VSKLLYKRPRSTLLFPSILDVCKASERDAHKRQGPASPAASGIYMVLGVVRIDF
jgi:hypothetical protein